MSESHTALQEMRVHHVCIPAGEAMLEGELHIPANASGIVLFAHGSPQSGSSSICHLLTMRRASYERF